jgi:uncharacterized protein (DUF1330 family)
MESHLRCAKCGATWVSPMARAMESHGGKCLACDGELEVVAGPGGHDQPSPTVPRAREES